MKLNDILSKIQNKQYVKITWLSELSSRMTPEAKRKGFIITKEVTSIVKINDILNPLPWGEYYLTPGIVRHHNKLYLKLRPTNKEPTIQYYVNGSPLSRSDFDQYPVMQPSYWLNKDTKTVKEMVLNIDNITKIEVIK